MFEGDIQIMRMARGDLFHDITKIKDITNDTIGQSITMDAKFAGDDAIVAQPDDSVKFNEQREQREAYARYGSACLLYTSRCV